MPEQDDPPRHPAIAAGPVGENQNSLTAGNRGPLPLSDWQSLAKLDHQNRKWIRENVVPTKGWGAHGTLRITGDISNLTCARVLQPGVETAMVARFSTVGGEVAAADHERDVRGFAFRFYTVHGNWDFVGFNTPVFFFRDPLKFSEFVDSQKRHPRTYQRSPMAMWAFWAQSPESLHLVTILFSDRGLPVSPMHMNGYGAHTYSLWNDRGEHVWVKFHFKTRQGHDHYTYDEAEAFTGRTQKPNEKALFDAIEIGNFPQWTMQIQIMTPEQARICRFNPFDITKVWPHADFPAIEIGVIELNRNLDNHFTEIEQLAFSPSNVVRGVGHSPDRMLQGRICTCADASRDGLASFFEARPIDRTRCPVHHHYYVRETQFFDDMRRSNAYYEPGSLSAPKQDEAFTEPPFSLSAPASRSAHRGDQNDLCQPRALFMLFDDGQKARLFANIAASLKDVSGSIQARQIDLFSQVHPDYGAGVCSALDMLDPQF